MNLFFIIAAVGLVTLRLWDEIKRRLQMRPIPRKFLSSQVIKFYPTSKSVHKIFRWLLLIQTAILIQIVRLEFHTCLSNVKQSLCLTYQTVNEIHVSVLARDVGPSSPKQLHLHSTQSLLMIQPVWAKDPDLDIFQPFQSPIQITVDWVCAVGMHTDNRLEGKHPHIPCYQLHLFARNKRSRGFVVKSLSS